MAAREGEQHLSTSFADVHYYFGDPTQNPAHHRFDKRSYVYLFKSITQQGQGRVEVANHAGTAAQDAFTGYLDSVHLDYSEKQPGLVSLSISEPLANSPQATPTGHKDWHLPSLDPQNQAKYMYMIRALDFYFWKESDAVEFVEAVTGILPPSQLTVLRKVTTPGANGSLSSVVQKLEQAAITTPAEAQGRNDSFGGVSSMASQPHTEQPQAVRAPGDTREAIKQEAHSNSADYAPLPYNPAAPAAPEQIIHREKTPPPVDGATGTGLGSAIAHDAGAVPSHPAHVNHGYFQPSAQQPHVPQQQQQYTGTPQRQGSFPPPPPSAVSQPYSHPSPDPSISSLGQQSNRHSSFPPPPSGASQPHSPPAQTASAGYNPTFAPPPQNPGFGSPPIQSPPAQGYQSSQSQSPQHFQQHYHPQQHQQALPPQPQHFNSFHQPQYHPGAVSPPPQQYTGHVQSPGYSTTPGAPSVGSAGTPQSTHSPTVPPIGGYSGYQYTPTGQAAPQQQQGEPYSVHDQVYRPTEGEAHHGPLPTAGPGQKAGRFEQRSAKVEKGVNRLFKKLDKKIG